jgi:hypothetical protein
LPREQVDGRLKLEPGMVGGSMLCGWAGGEAMTDLFVAFVFIFPAKTKNARQLAA